MKSIRVQLMVILLGGLSVLFVASGLGLFGFLHYVLLLGFDDVLVSEARFFANTTEQREDGSLESDVTAQDSAERGRHTRMNYFQVWTQGGKMLLRSPSLGASDLFGPPEGSDEPDFRNTVLPDGNAGRAVVIRYFAQESDDEPHTAGREQHPLVLAFALSRETLDHTLEQIAEGFVAFCAFLILCVIPVVWWSVKRGLHSLNYISDETRTIGATNLSYRFEIESMPGEVVPVCRCLNDLLDRLEGAFARERRFTGDAAHELRTPIAELRTLAEVGLAEAKDSYPAMVGHFQDALDVARQLESLVTALLALARCESDRGEVEMRAVDLARLLREAWQSLVSKNAVPGLRLKLDVPEEVTVCANPEMLKTMVVNLLSNALSYTTENGGVTISVSHSRGSWLVRVANTCNQLESSDIPHVFEPFWRKEAGRCDKEHSGLGLALVASLARLMAIPLRAELTSENVFVIEFECAEAITE